MNEFIGLKLLGYTHEKTVDQHICVIIKKARPLHRIAFTFMLDLI